jgi:hypothetical protein
MRGITGAIGRNREACPESGLGLDDWPRWP